MKFVGKSDMSDILVAVLGVVLLVSNILAEYYAVLSHLSYGIMTLLFSLVVITIIRISNTLKYLVKQHWDIEKTMNLEINFDLFFKRIPSSFSYELIDFNTIKLTDPAQFTLFWRNTIINTHSSWNSTSVIFESSYYSKEEYDIMGIQGFLTKALEADGRIKHFSRIFIFVDLDELKKNFKVIKEMNDRGLDFRCFLYSNHDFQHGILANFNKVTNDFCIIDDKYVVLYYFDRKKGTANEVICSCSENLLKERQSMYETIRDNSRSFEDVERLIYG